MKNLILITSLLFSTITNADISIDKRLQNVNTSVNSGILLQETVEISSVNTPGFSERPGIMCEIVKDTNDRPSAVVASVHSKNINLLYSVEPSFLFTIEYRPWNLAFCQLIEAVKATANTRFDHLPATLTIFQLPNEQIIRASLRVKPQSDFIDEIRFTSILSDSQAKQILQKIRRN